MFDDVELDIKYTDKKRSECLTKLCNCKFGLPYQNQYFHSLMIYFFLEKFEIYVYAKKINKLKKNERKKTSTD